MRGIVGGLCGEAAAAHSLEQLAEALATVQRRCPELAVLAIPWLHLKHPLQPVQELLVRGGSVPVGALVFARRRIESVLYAGYCWGRLVLLRCLMRRELAALVRRSFDIIAKTWVPGVPGGAREDDFYFGTLQQRLAQRNIRMLFICGNTYGGSWTRFAKACASGMMSSILSRSGGIVITSKASRSSKSLRNRPSEASICRSALLEPTMRTSTCKVSSPPTL